MKNDALDLLSGDEKRYAKMITTDRWEPTECRVPVVGKTADGKIWIDMRDGGAPIPFYLGSSGTWLGLDLKK